MNVCLALNRKPCLKSSPNSTIHGDVLRRARITIASTKTSVPRNHARPGQKYAANAGGPPLTFTHACTIRPSFPGVDFTTPQSFSTTAQLINSHKHTSKSVFAVLSLHSAILAPSAASLHPCFASLFSHCSSSSFQSMFSMPKKTVFLPFDVLHDEPFINTHLCCIQPLPLHFLNLVEPNSLSVHLPFLAPSLPAHHTSTVRQLPAIPSSIPDTPSRQLRSTQQAAHRRVPQPFVAPPLTTRLHWRRGSWHVKHVLCR